VEDNRYNSGKDIKIKNNDSTSDDNEATVDNNNDVIGLEGCINYINNNNIYE